MFSYPAVGGGHGVGDEAVEGEGEARLPTAGGADEQSGSAFFEGETQRGARDSLLGAVVLDARSKYI